MKINVFMWTLAIIWSILISYMVFRLMGSFDIMEESINETREIITSLESEFRELNTDLRDFGVEIIN